jgi:tetratricopeptide (TPR) repeat protein
VREHDRFWMLETIREYAAELLEDSGEAEELGRRHAEHFLALAEEAAAHLEWDQGPWLKRLEAEIDNFRAALDVLEAGGESQGALRLAGSLTGFWEGGYLTEGRQRLETLLSTDERPTAARGLALVGAATMARQSGDPATARLHGESARVLYAELGDSRGTAEASILLGLADADEGNFLRARQTFEDSAQLYRDAGDELGALFASRLVAWTCSELGERERAWELYEHNLNWARALGNKPLEAQTLGAVASMALEQGRADDAISLMQDVLRIDRELGVRFQTSIDLTRFARVLAFAGGAAEEATRLLSCADARREEIGAGTPPRYLVILNDEAIAAIRERLEEAAFSEAWQQGRMFSLDDAVAIALGELDSDA